MPCCDRYPTPQAASAQTVVKRSRLSRSSSDRTSRGMRSPATIPSRMPPTSKSDFSRRRRLDQQTGRIVYRPQRGVRINRQVFGEAACPELSVLCVDSVPVPPRPFEVLHATRSSFLLLAALDRVLEIETPLRCRAVRKAHDHPDDRLFHRGVILATSGSSG